jgi:Protein of unknown function (DUF2283)
MDAKLGFEYDREGDILYINKRPAYAEQESEEIDYGVIARLNPDTNEIENCYISSNKGSFTLDYTREKTLSAAFGNSMGTK